MHDAHPQVFVQRQPARSLHITSERYRYSESRNTQSDADDSARAAHARRCEDERRPLIVASLAKLAFGALIMTGDTAPLAMTMGDPAGIGPELALAARRDRSANAPFVVFGAPGVLAAAARRAG